MLKETRRVTTGIDSDGKSIVVADEKIQTMAPYQPLKSFLLQNVFYTENHPQTLHTRHLEQTYQLQLPEGAMRILKVRFGTQKEIIADLEEAGQPIPSDWAKFNLHRTNSADYIYILKGSVICVVGDQKIVLKSGDFLAQIGPEHTWINENAEACEALCIMIGVSALQS